MPEPSGPVPYDFCNCGVPNALTATRCAGCGTDLDRSSIPQASTPEYAAPVNMQIQERIEPLEPVNPLDALRQSLDNRSSVDNQSNISDKDDSAQGFDFCPQCHAPNALNRAECAGCGAALSRDGMFQSSMAPVEIIESSIDDDKPRYSRDLRPSRPTSLKSSPPVPEQEPVAQGTNYDFCTCGVPNAMTATRCAGCGKDLERSAPARQAVPPKAPIAKTSGPEITQRLIQQSVRHMSGAVSTVLVPETPNSPTEPDSGAQPGYIFCKCGVPNSTTAAACVACGAKLEGTSPDRGVGQSPPIISASQALQQEHPVNTGASVIFCAKCGVPNQNDSMYCAGCGYALKQSAPASAPFAPSAAVKFPVAQPSAAARFPVVAPAIKPNFSSTISGTDDVAGLSAPPVFRNPLLVFALSFITLDLYRAYWNFVITKEIQACLQEKITDPSMAVTAFLLSCGLYDYYWDWVVAKKIARMMELTGLEPVDYSWLFLFLNITIVGRVAIPTLMQVNLNEISQCYTWVSEDE